MSLNSLAAQTKDQTFIDRINASVFKETYANAQFKNSDFGQAILNQRTLPLPVFLWPVSVANEAAYEYALNAGNPNPGGDATVVTDADIQAAVQANWPPDPWPAPVTP